MQRRTFLVNSGKFIAISSLSAYFSKANIQANNWSDFINKRTADASVTAAKVIGSAWSLDAVIKEGQELNGDLYFIVSEDSQLILQLPGNRLLWASDDTRFNLFPSSIGCIISIIKGQIMLLTPYQAPFMPMVVHSVKADYGLRDGVLFTKVLDKNLLAVDSSSSELVPLEYTCPCNGNIDMLDTNFNRTLQTLSASHHNSFFLREPGKYMGAPLLFHDDNLIAEISKYFKNPVPKYPWLNLD